jgi:hypothetical protein
MDQCTQNYECIVMNNNSQSNKLEDTVFWYKAEMHGEFRIGAQEFWTHAMANTKDKDGDGGNEYDANAAKRLKGPMIQVRKFPQN